MAGSSRRDVRFRVRFPAQLRHGRKVWSLFTEDVSFRGVFVRTDTPPPLRALVELRLLIPPGHVAFTTHGMAVHVVVPDNGMGRTPGVGVELYGLDREAREEWEEFVRQVSVSCPPSEDQAPLVSAAPPKEPIRRRSKRHTAVLRVQVETMRDLYELYTGDVSNGGMFIATEVELAPRTQVVVHVPHPESDEVFLLDAVVRHRQNTPGLSGVGVEFAPMDRARRHQFLDFVRGGIHVDEDEDVA